MLKISILVLLFLISSCGLLYSNQPNVAKVPSVNEANNNTAMPSNIVDANTTKKTESDSELRERIKSFYSYTKNDFRNKTEDEKFLKSITSSPRDKTVNALIALQNNYKNNYELQAKAAYLLVELKYNEDTNRKELLKIFSIYKDTSDSKFSKEHIIEMIGEILGSSDKDGSFLFDAFDLATIVDGAYGESFSGILADYYKKNPKIFLVKLKSKSGDIVEKVIFSLFYAEHKEVILKKLDAVSRMVEVKDLVNQIKDFAKNNNVQSNKS